MDVQSLNAHVGRSRNPATDPEGLRKSKELQELKRIDQKVRAHEAAHRGAGAGLIRGGPSYTYQRGPDGQLYAVAGEVTLDTSPVPGDPAATAAKMQQVQAAALAPSDPSPQDRAVAARAGQVAAQARAEAAAEAARAAEERLGQRLDVRV